MKALECTLAFMLRRVLVATLLVSCSSSPAQPPPPPDTKPSPPTLGVSFRGAYTAHPIHFPIELLPSGEICDGFDCQRAEARILDARISGGDDTASLTFTDDRIVVTGTAPGRIHLVVDAHVGNDPRVDHEYLDLAFFEASLATWSSAGSIPNLAYPVLPGTRFQWRTATQSEVPIDAIEVTVSGALGLEALLNGRPHEREDRLEATTAGVGTFVARAGPLSTSRTVRVAAPGHVKSVALHEAAEGDIDSDTPWMKEDAASSTIRPGTYGIVLTFDDGSIAVGGFDGIERPHAAAYAIRPCDAPRGTPAATIGCAHIYRAYRGRSPLTIRAGDARADYTVEVL